MSISEQTAVVRALLAWLFQLLASCAWVVSVIIYGSYESGDIMQLVAALSWTLSNAFAMPEAVLPLFSRRRPPADARSAGGEQACADGDTWACDRARGYGFPDRRGL